MRLIVLAIAALSIAATLPDPSKTPGEANPVLTQQKLCSKSFRTGPYRKVPQSLKNQVYKLYGAVNHKGVCAGKEGCEVDHLISLEIGGANTIKNLWPEPYPGTWGAHTKDKLENRLHKLVCAKTITLEEAQKAISTDWIAAYRKYIGAKP